VHRKEGQIYTDEEASEMDLRQKCVVSNTNKFTKSIINSSENSKNSTHGEYIVEMGNNVVRIMECYIKASICKNNTGYTSNGK